MSNCRYRMTKEDDPYAPMLVATYKYWSLYVSDNQQYLGRLVIWCHREDAEDLTEATPAEFMELQGILKDVRKATIKLFQASWLNYAFLGNETKHLHGHIIPRYDGVRLYRDREFSDPLFGCNYQTDHGYATDTIVLRSVIIEYREYFDR